MSDEAELLSVKNKVESILLGNTGSFSGVGMSSSDDTVNVYVRKDDEKARNKAKQLLGSEKKANGYDLRFIESGHVTALSVPFVNRTTYTRPLYGGSSISSEDILAGTFGCVVYDADTKQKYMLTNSHVIARSSTYNSPTANIGDLVYAPGCLDSGSCLYSIGKLERYIPFNELEINFVDCAISVPNNDTEISDEIIGIGVPKGYEEAKEGQNVIKSGRTSGITESKIIDTHATMEVDYNGKLMKFANCIITSAMAMGGDSGSVLLNKETNNVNGLLFAGSDSITVFDRIEYVLNLLNVTITPNGVVPSVEQYATSIDSPNFIQNVGVLSLGVVTGLSIIDQISRFNR